MHVQDGRGKKEQSKKKKNIPTEAAESAETPFSTVANDDFSDRGASRDNKMPQDDRLDEEIVHYREE